MLSRDNNMTVTRLFVHVYVQNIAISLFDPLELCPRLSKGDGRIQKLLTAMVLECTLLSKAMDLSSILPILVFWLSSS